MLYFGPKRVVGLKVRMLGDESLIVVLCLHRLVFRLHRFEDFAKPSIDFQLDASLYAVLVEGIVFGDLFPVLDRLLTFKNSFR
jgi:hypothetical protein